jgi:hypothetical protein
VVTSADSLRSFFKYRDADLWRAKRKVEDDEQLDVELDALSAVDDHAAALKLRDVDLVSKLLDDVLIENGLTIPSHRRREFALALLHARLRTLEVGVKRTKGEIKGDALADQGITVNALLDAYLIERHLPPKSEAEFRAATLTGVADPDLRAGRESPAAF